MLFDCQYTWRSRHGKQSRQRFRGCSHHCNAYGIISVDELESGRDQDGIRTESGRNQDGIRTRTGIGALNIGTVIREEDHQLGRLVSESRSRR